MRQLSQAGHNASLLTLITRWRQQATRIDKDIACCVKASQLHFKIAKRQQGIDLTTDIPKVMIKRTSPPKAFASPLMFAVQTESLSLSERFIGLDFCHVGSSFENGVSHGSNSELFENARKPERRMTISNCQSLFRQSAIVFQPSVPIQKFVGAGSNDLRTSESIRTLGKSMI
jgi:hypothetical protein